ncbi:hypothetical protein [Ralstonia solanacearum]|uniref:hypothetical protein n=1 Tax=Ralstonia solanacearum TaxID=305 RepID=UPI0012D75817|nr:hypothetical protein [Ralstonia solanacearum]
MEQVDHSAEIARKLLPRLGCVVTGIESPSESPSLSARYPHLSISRAATLSDIAFQPGTANEHEYWHPQILQTQSKADLYNVMDASTKKRSATIQISHPKVSGGASREMHLAAQPTTMLLKTLRYTKCEYPGVKPVLQAAASKQASHQK